MLGGNGWTKNAGCKAVSWLDDANFGVPNQSMHLEVRIPKSNDSKARYLHYNILASRNEWCLQSSFRRLRITDAHKMQRKKGFGPHAMCSFRVGIPPQNVPRRPEQKVARQCNKVA